MLRFAPAVGSASSSSSSSSEADSGASDPLARSIFIVASFPSGGTRAYAACVPSSWRATAAASVLLSVRPGAEAWLANDCAAVVGSVGSVGSAPSAPGAGPARAAACASDAAVANGETGDVVAADHGGAATAAGTAVVTTGATPATSAPGAAVERPSSAIEVPFSRAPEGQAEDRTIAPTREPFGLKPRIGQIRRSRRSRPSCIAPPTRRASPPPAHGDGVSNYARASV